MLIRPDFKSIFLIEFLLSIFPPEPLPLIDISEKSHQNVIFLTFVNILSKL